MTVNHDGDAPDRRTARRFPAERRIIWARMPVTQVAGTRTAVSELLTLLDLSRTGLAVRLQHEVYAGDTIHLQFWSLSHRAVTVPATIMHVTRLNHARPNAHYVAGAKFLPTDPTAMLTIESLVDSIRT